MVSITWHRSFSTSIAIVLGQGKQKSQKKGAATPHQDQWLDD